MSNIHIFSESSAFGDTAINLCRQNIAMCHGGHTGVILHTTKELLSNGTFIPSNPLIYEIWKRTSFIKEIVFDVEYDDMSSFKFSKKYNVPIEHPYEYRYVNNIKEWVDLEEFIPNLKDDDRKIALFQPISLKTKPKDYLNDYIPVWKRCLTTLVKNNYRIIMIGAKDDPIDLCVEKKFLNNIENMCGKWNMLESIAFAIYKSNVIVSCDSWAGLWGIAAQIPTAIAWGYRMENDIDFWCTNFLGNIDKYQYGWSSQKDYCDALLASYLGELKNV